MRVSKPIYAIILCLFLTFSLLTSPLSSIEESELEAEGVSYIGTEAPRLTTGDSNIYIYTLNDLNNVRNNLNGHYVLMADINASDTVTWNGGQGFLTIGDHFSNFFNGIFDGNNHTVSGLFLNKDDINSALFGKLTSDALVMDLTLSGIDNTGLRFVAGISGYNSGLITRCHVQGHLNTSDYENGYIGAITCMNDATGRVIDCTSMVIINSTYNCGGIVASNNGLIENCSSSGVITGNRSEIGGLAGYNAGIIESSHTNATVNGYYTTGGFVGLNHGDIWNSSASGTVVSDQYTGGFVGQNRQGSIISCNATGDVTGVYSTGGFIGSAESGTIKFCFAEGDVVGSDMVGGFIGQMYSTANSHTYVYDCYCTGQVNASGIAGGFVGYNTNSLSCYRSYTISSVSGSTVNAFASFTGQLQGCFWNTDISSTSGGGIGKTTAEMKQVSTFTSEGWAIGSVWTMIDNLTYPTLTGITLAAIAGPDQQVDVGDTVTFDGSQSVGISINNYTWTFQYNGSAQTLYGVSPSFIFNNSGYYNVTLTIRDDTNTTDDDNMHVTVNDSVPPIADAGQNVSVSEPGVVTFNGSASFDDDGITNYTWSFLYNGSIVTLYGISPSFDFQLPGQYQVTLVVSDAQGNEDTATVQITVGGAGGDEPAGGDSNYYWVIILLIVVAVGGYLLYSRR